MDASGSDISGCWRVFGPVGKGNLVPIFLQVVEVFVRVPAAAGIVHSGT